MNLYLKFRATIKRDGLIQERNVVLVGVSGGLDSMALGSLLIRLQKDIPFKLALVHINYQLRGRESDAQEELARAFAEDRGVDFFSTRASLDVKGGENFQQSAREFRYHYFAERASQIGAGKVAVAHHHDDQVETIVAQLLRGASVRGLAGMRPSREIRNPNIEIRNKFKIQNLKIQLIRPLLQFSKGQLAEYARENGVSFIEDSSNASPKYWRNRLRHELLPLLEDLRPKVFEKITAFGEEMRGLADYLAGEAQTWLKAYARREGGRFWLPRPRWAGLPGPLRLEILCQVFSSFDSPCKNLKRDHLLRCDSISRGAKSEGSYSLPEGFQFVRRGDNLWIEVVSPL